MLYFTGDVHGNIKGLLYRLDRMGIPHTPDQIIVLLGDVGVNYLQNTADYVNKKRLQDSGRTYFCIHGNHEMRPESIASYQEQLGNFGMVYVEQEFPNLQFAKDGELYDLEGYKTLVLGGAYSVDKFYRLECGARWFADEQITPERRKAILEQITTFGQLDLVLSHTCPYSWQPTDLFLNGLDQSTVDNSMEKWLEEVETHLNYRHWLFAHFHDDRKINSKVTMLFNTIKIINQIMEG